MAYQHYLALARCQPDGGLCFTYSRDEARSIRQRSVSSAKSTRRLMRLTSLTRQAGVCAVPNAWEEAT